MTLKRNGTILCTVKLSFAARTQNKDEIKQTKTILLHIEEAGGHKLNCYSAWKILKFEN